MESKVFIVDYIGVHSGMKYYMDSFTNILKDVGIRSIEVLSNYSTFNAHPFFPNFFCGNILNKINKLAYSIIKLLFFTLKNRNSVIIVLSYGTIIDFFVLLCTACSKHRIVDGHEIIHQGKENNALYQYLFKYIYANNNIVIIHSDKSQEVLNKLGYKGTVMRVPHFEYNLDAKYDETMIGDEIKNAISLEKKNFLFFGSLSYNKGVDIIITNVLAMPDVVKDRINVIIAGKPTDETYSRLDTTSTVFNTIIRYINDDEMKYLFSHTDYVVLPYRVTYQSGVIEMAFNYCKPVLASDIPYFIDVLKSYPSFGFITGLDSKSFKNNIKKLSNLSINDFYNTKDVYSYHHKPEIDNFVNEMRCYLNLNS